MATFYQLIDAPTCNCVLDRYAILRKWRSALAAKKVATRDAFRSTFSRLEHEGALPASVDVDSVTNEPFFVYTSNVRPASPCH